MTSTKRITDWDSAEVRLTPSKTPQKEETGSVRIEKRQVIAYFDDLGRPAKPDVATRAKVWTPDGSSRIVRL